MSDFVIESPNYHTSHVVRDMFEAADRYIRLFDRAVLYTGPSLTYRRRAAFVLVAEAWIELVNFDGDAQGFLDRFGEHLHGVAFKVRNIDALAQTLLDHNVRFADAAGNRLGASVPRKHPLLHPRHGPSTPVTGAVECEPDWWTAAMYPHMGDIHGWFEFAEHKVHGNRFDPRHAPGWKPTAVLGDPLGIIRLSHNTIVVGDLDAAVELWRSAMNGEVVRAGRNEILGTHSAWIRVGEGEGTILEFAQPDTAGPAADDYSAAERDVLHCTTFLVDNLDQVRQHLDEIECRIETDSAELVVTDPGWCLGARYGFTTAAVSD